MSIKRDTARHRRYIAEAARGDEALVEHVEHRLAAGDEIYGDSYRWVGVRKLITELREEAADLAAWAALTDEALDRASDLSDLHRTQLRGVVAVAARRGAQAHDLLSQALRSLERAR